MRLRKGKRTSEAPEVPKEMVEDDNSYKIDKEPEVQAGGTLGGVADVKEALDGLSTKEIRGEEEREVEDDVVDAGMTEDDGKDNTVEAEDDVAYGRGSLTRGVGTRLGMKRARLRAWKKYFRMEKAKLMHGDLKGKIDLQLFEPVWWETTIHLVNPRNGYGQREIGRAWRLQSQAFRDSYLCDDPSLESERGCRNSEVIGRTLNTRCCPGRVACLRETLSPQQVVVVEELGFRSILSVDDIKIKRDLCLKLFEHLDLNQLELNYEGVKFSLSASELARVKGLSNEGSKVPLYGSPEAIKELKEKFCTHVRGIPINELVEKIKSTVEIDTDFRFMICTLIMYTILAPGSGVVIPHRYLHGAADVGKISEKNWAKWSFNYLVAGIKKFKGRKTQQYVCGNLLFLQIMFFEAFSSGKSYVPSDVTPIVHWTKAAIKKLMREMNRTGRGFLCQESDIFGTLRGGRATVDPSTKNDVSTIESVGRLTVQVERIMKFLGITEVEDKTETSIKEELVILNQSVSRLAYIVSGGCGNPPNTELDAMGTINETQNDGQKDNVVYSDVAKEMKDVNPVEKDGNAHRSEAPFLDDEDFLNELIRDPGDVEYVKKLIGRHHEVDLKEAMNDLMKGLSDAAKGEKDSAEKRKEVS